MKLLVDMNLSPRWIGVVLADAGIEAAHWSSLGANNAPDPNGTSLSAVVPAKAGSQRLSLCSEP